MVDIQSGAAEIRRGKR